MADTSRQFSDREIAEDILTSHKYLANYFYAPAILESQNPELRSVLQQVYSDTQSEARQVFDYLNSKGWYPVKPADNADLTELKNVAERSRNSVNAIIQGGQNPAMGMQQGQFGYQGQTWQAGTSGVNPQAQQGVWESQGAGWQSGAQWQTGNPGWAGTGQWGTGAGWHPASTYGYGSWQRGQWTGTQYGEGQGSMGPSSVGQWSRWGGQPSWTGFGGTGYGGAGQWGYHMPAWQQQTTGWQTGGFGTGWQGGRWTGTEAGEGQTGMGPSSVAQWSRWGGQPSWIGYGGQGYGAGAYGTGAFGTTGATRPLWQQPDLGQRMYPGSAGGTFPVGYPQGAGTWYGGPGGSYQVNLPDWARQDRPELGTERG